MATPIRLATMRVVLVLALLLVSLASLPWTPTARAVAFQIEAGDVDALIAAILTANANGEPDEIILDSREPYTLQSIVADSTGLPLITSEITITGNGATITRADNAPDFRILQVVEGGTLHLDNITISNGHSESEGGGIHNHGGTVTLTNSTVSGNEAVDGGAISNFSGSVTVTSSTISGNRAAQRGGGMFNFATLTLVNSTVSGNIAGSDNEAGQGGGIYSSNSLSLTNSTIGLNDASRGYGPGVYGISLSLSLTNTIIAGNIDVIEDLTLAAYSPVSGGGHNLIGVGDPSYQGLAHGTNGNLIGTSQNPIDPLLGELDDNGGPTQTMALLPGSPAINAGNDDVAPATDQRGIERNIGPASDIGAFEYEVFDTTGPIITPNPTGELGTNGWYTSDVTVNWSVTDAESDVSGTSGCDTTSITTDTSGTTYTCEATSLGGTSSESVTIARDATDPVVTYSGNLSHYGMTDTIAITCTATDAMSGVASHTCANIDGTAMSFGPGVYTYSASAIDAAGNTSSSSISFMVGASYDELCAYTSAVVRQASVVRTACTLLAVAEQASASGNQTMARLAMLNYEMQIQSAIGRRYISRADANILLEWARAIQPAN